MNEDFYNLINKLNQINEGASIISLDVNAVDNQAQNIKSVMVGIALNSGAQISATFQAPCYETLMDSLEKFFQIQEQIVQQAIEQVSIMAEEDADSAMVQDPGMGVYDDPASMGGEEIPTDDIGGEFDAGMEPGMEPETDDTIPAFDAGGEPNGIPAGEDEVADDVVVDPDAMEPEIGDDVDTDEARYSHNYSFRQSNGGLFQSLTGQQRIRKGALRSAKKRLGN